MQHGRKRAAPEQPAPSFDNRLELLPKDIGHLILQFCRYDGLWTAMNFADVLLCLSPTVYWEVHLEELARLMPQFMRATKGAPRAALQRELAAVGTETKLRGIYLAPSARERMRDWLREHRDKACRFCADDCHDTPLERRDDAPLARGLRRSLGAYSHRRVYSYSHSSCFFDRLLTLRLDESDRRAWQRLRTTVPRGILCGMHRNTEYMLVGPSEVCVRTDAWAAAQERYWAAQRMFSGRLIPRLDRWLEQSKAQGLASLTPSMLASETLDFMELARTAPNVTLGDAWAAVIEARVYENVLALREAFDRFSQKTDDYGRFIALAAAFAGEDAEQLLDHLVRVARETSQAAKSVFVFSTTAHSKRAVNMINTVVWQREQQQQHR